MNIDRLRTASAIMRKGRSRIAPMTNGVAKMRSRILAELDAKRVSKNFNINGWIQSRMTVMGARSLVS